MVSVFALLALLLAAPPEPAAEAAGSAAEARRQRIREHLNWERSVVGLPPLRSDPRLDRAAQARAELMARGGLQPLPALRDQLARWEYEAVAAELVKMLGGASPESNLADLIERNRRFHDVLLGSELPDVGIGVSKLARRRLDLIVLALSEEEAFARKTAGLGDREAVRRQLLDWTNWAREKYSDAPPLANEPCLARVAQEYAERMLAEGFFSHFAPDGADVLRRVRAAGCGVRSTAENLASGPEAAVDVISGWLESPGHRRALLSGRYDGVGFGLAYGAGPEGRKIVWVQVLGR